MTLTSAVNTKVYRNAGEHVTNAVRQASSATGVDFSYLMANAAAESGFRTDVKASTSSATGLYQFIDSTWMGMISAHGAEIGLGKEAAAIKSGTLDSGERERILALRKDPNISAYMAASYAKDNKERLERTVGGVIGGAELYMAHFLGARGAEKFLNAWKANPDAPAATVVPEAASANRTIFYRNGRAQTLDEVYQRMAAKVGVEAPEPSATQMWLARYKPGSKLGAKAATQMARNTRPITGNASSLADVMAPTAAALGRTPSTLQTQLYMASLSMPGEKARPGQAAARDAARHLTGLGASGMTG